MHLTEPVTEERRQNRSLCLSFMSRRKALHFARSFARSLAARARARSSPSGQSREPVPDGYQVRFRECCAFTMLLRGAGPLDRAKAPCRRALNMRAGVGAAMRDSTRILTNRPGSPRREKARGASRVQGEGPEREKKNDENRVGAGTRREARKRNADERRYVAGSAQRYSPHRLGIHECFKWE